MFAQFRILHTPWNGGNTSDISEAVDLSENEGIKTTVDTFQFSIPAHSGYDNFFEVDDNIKIYLWNDNDAETLVMDGYTDSFQRVENVDRNVWQIKGVNRLERLLNVQIGINLTNDTAPNMIAAILDKVNDQNIARAGQVEKKINYTVGNPATSTITNLKSDGTSFTNIPSYRRNTQTPAYQMIEELSGTRFTNDKRAYITYLDNANSLHWIYKTDTPQGTKITRGDNIKEYTVEKSIFDIINSVIINGGTDFNGRGITDRYYDITIMARYGAKTRYFNIPNIAEELKLGSSAGPFGASFPFGRESLWTGGNAQFRTDTRAEIRRKGQSIVQVLGNARFKSKITVTGTTAFTKGGQYTIEVPGVFTARGGARLQSKDMRLEEVEHSVNARGWNTTLSLVEDEQSAVGALL